MSARAAIQSLLDAEVGTAGRLRALGFQAVYASNSVDTPEEKKFVIVRWEEQDQQFGRKGPQRVSIWLHSRDRDYGPIDRGLEVAKDVISAAVHLPGADGWTLTQADWRGDSRDLFDDGFSTITKNSSFDVVSRYATTQI